MTGTPRVELLHIPDCPHVDEARAMLRACLGELDLAGVEIAKQVGNYPSPSILVNGIDVMGTPPLRAASCRLDVPTRDRVLRALLTAERTAV